MKTHVHRVCHYFIYAAQGFSLCRNDHVDDRERSSSLDSSMSLPSFLHPLKFSCWTPKKGKKNKRETYHQVQLVDWLRTRKAYSIWQIELYSFGGFRTPLRERENDGDRWAALKFVLCVSEMLEKLSKIFRKGRRGELFRGFSLSSDSHFSNFSRAFPVDERTIMKKIPENEWYESIYSSLAVTLSPASPSILCGSSGCYPLRLLVHVGREAREEADELNSFLFSVQC